MMTDNASSPDDQAQPPLKGPMLDCATPFLTDVALDPGACLDLGLNPNEPGLAAGNAVSSTRASATLSDLRKQAKVSAHKIITKNGERYVALIDAKPLDYYRRLEREHIHPPLIDDARRGVAGIASGWTQDAYADVGWLQARRAPVRQWLACRAR